MNTLQDIDDKISELKSLKEKKEKEILVIDEQISEFRKAKDNITMTLYGKKKCEEWVLWTK